MIRAAILTCLVTVVAAAQPEIPREVMELSRIQQKMREHLSRLPDYTCVETIARGERPTSSSMFRPLDTVRVEVLHVGNKELYGWPGAKTFGESLSLLVGAGTTSSGEFALHARSIFLGNSQSKYVGEERIRGRRALRYDYRIPLFSSGLTLSYAGRSGHVSTSGSFWADAETLDLLRLDVHAGDIPPDLPYLTAVSTVDYGRVRIGGVNTLLPESAELVLTKRSGSADHNHLQFSQCRAYASESAIRFETAAQAAADEAVVPKTAEVALPADLLLALQLDEAIDSTKAMEGDLITARLTQAVKQKKETLVPLGAIAKGRIRRLETYDQPRPHFIVGLEFLELEFDGKRAAFAGRLDWIDAVPGITWFLHTSKTKDELIHEESIRTAQLPGVGAFFVEGTSFRLPAGFHMLWRTIDLRK